ncbi:MAG: chemotaxis protein CheW [Bauldia sp.]
MMRQRKRFDWQAIHAALDRRLSGLGSTIEDDAEAVRDLLRKRSIALAATVRDPRAQNQLTRLLVFRLGEERYALALDCAREVTGLSWSAAIPGAGPGIVGIVNWRGEFAVVFDLAPILGLPASADRAQRRVIVLRGEEPPVGLAVDAVEEIIHIDLTALTAREQLRSKHVELFRGATADAVLVLAEDTLRARLAQELKAA